MTFKSIVKNSAEAIFYIVFCTICIFSFYFVFDIPVDSVLSENESSVSLERTEVQNRSELENISEEPIDLETYNWKGEASDPMQIEIPSIPIQTFIESSGIDSATNEIAVPTNTNLVGWFNGSSRPGEPGLSIISGHFDGPTRAGIFLNLDTLKVGDEFYIKNGDLSSLQFRVKEVKTVSSEEAINYLFSGDPSIKSQLNLITCGGGFDYETNRYQDRVIVSSEFIQKV